jgi:putative peptidoglycan lipid II flippase
VSKRTDSPGPGSLASAALTAASTLVVAAFAAVVGVIIAREFGRTDETDGFFAAYGVFLVIVLAAQAIRISVLPSLARARSEGRLAGETMGFAIAIAVVAVPVLVATELAAGPIADLLTGGGSEAANDAASTALRWMIPAAVAHLFAGLAASGLAALDDYATAAVGYAGGSAAALALIVARVDADGIVAVAWGMALNGAIALLVPLLLLVWRARSTRMPAGAARPSGLPLPARLAAFAAGAALPIALQALYVLCLPFAGGGGGTGAVSSFTYAYLGSSALVAVTASSLGLVSSVPLTRAGMGPAEAARHVVSTSWLALAFVGGAAGLFAAAGGDVVEAVLGEAYGGDVGEEVGELVVALSPWMVVSIGVSVAFPLTFVADRTRGLPWIGLGAVTLQMPLAWAGWEAFELVGLALALAISTLAALASVLAELGVLRAVARGLVRATATLAALTLLAFVPPALLLGSVAAAVTGALLYLVLVAALRPRGLRGAWEYLRALG